jgi:D-arabinose 1-dehydrogenase-like Zn-dependent alcohol dehydrogenase
VNEDWGPAKFPMVPGHEIGGIVAAVGANVTKFVVGDSVCKLLCTAQVTDIYIINSISFHNLGGHWLLG